jgi:hypothetical protein
VALLLGVADSNGRFARANSSEIEVFDLPGRKFLADVPPQPAAFELFARTVLHPNGKWIVAVSNAPAYALNIDSGKRVEELGFATRDLPPAGGAKGSPDPRAGPRRAEVRASGGFTFRPDGGLFAFTGTEGVEGLPTAAGPDPMWLTSNQDPLGQPSGPSFTPDGKRLVGLSHGEYGPLEAEWPEIIGVGRMADRKVMATGKGPTPVNDAALSPDGHWLAVACEDGRVRVYAAATGAEVLALKGHTGPVNGVAFSKDGRLLASAGEASDIRVWKATEPWGRSPRWTAGQSEAADSESAGPAGERPETDGATTHALPAGRRPGQLTADPGGRALAAASGWARGPASGSGCRLRSTTS